MAKTASFGEKHAQLAELFWAICSVSVYFHKIVSCFLYWSFHFGFLNNISFLFSNLNDISTLAARLASFS
jgi:hypothetical protein